MVAQDLTMFCMSQTPFHPDGSLDEAGVRAHVRRLTAADNGVFLGGSGSGEGHSLSIKELRRLYEVGVDEAKGKALIYAGPREARNAASMLEAAREAVGAKVHVVQFYQLDAGHGMIPNEREQETYFSTLLSAIDHPAWIAVIPNAVRYSAPVPLLKRLCARFPQIRGIAYHGDSMEYFLQLREALPDTVKIYTGFSNLLQFVTVGAAGTQHGYNAIPRIVQRVAEGFASGDLQRVTESNRVAHQFGSVASGARRMKASLKILGLGNGVLRPPYLPLSPEEEQQLAASITKLHIRELEGLDEPVASATSG